MLFFATIEGGTIMIMINFSNMAVADINLLIENILSYKRGVFVLMDAEETENIFAQ